MDRGLFVKYVFFLLFAYSASFANPKEKSVCSDTVIVNKAIIDTIHRVISDSVTIKALENSQTFYNNAFDTLLFKVSIVLCIIGILVAIFGIFLGIAKSNKEKEFERVNKRILDLEKNFKEQIENNKKEMQNNFNILFSNVAHNYFTLAQKSEEQMTILINLSSMYYILSRMNELEDFWLYLLKRTQGFLGERKEGEAIEDIYGSFFHSLLLFIENSEKIDTKTFFKETKDMYNDLLKKFDYDKIKKALEDYLKNSKFDIKEALVLFEKYKDNK
jgi:hypothetical protein